MGGAGRVVGRIVAGLALVVLGACGDDGSASAPTTTDAAPPVERTTTSRVVDPEKAKAAGETIELDSARRLDDGTRAEAEDLRRRAIAAVEAHGWSDPGRAAADGFVPMFGEEQHLVNPAYVVDGIQWDVDRPEFLVLTQDGAVAGLMFAPGDASLQHPPPPGAPLIRWHYHRWGSPVCLRDGIVTVALPDPAGACPEDSVASHESGLMAHVWTIDIDDPFTSDMSAHDHGS